MTYIENVLVCMAAPLLVALLLLRRKQRPLLLFCLAGMGMCLLAAYLNTFFAQFYAADALNAATQIAPVVEEIMKLLPLLFYLAVFEPDAERFRLAFETVKPLRQEGDKTIALIHYPPFNLKREDSLFTSLFENNGVDKVIFGHLHGPVFFPLSSEKNGVEYHLTSCDKTDFKLVKIY